jgi:plastocyanin
MKRSFVAFLALVFTSTLLSGLVLAQETHEVHLNIMPVEGRPIPEFFFQPTGLFIEPGDSVSFIADTPHHTATAYHAQHVKTQRVPEGVEPFSSPIIPISQTWEYTFTEPGVYDLWCGPHEQYGMAMRIVVGEASGPGTEEITNFNPDGVFATAGTVLSDPALNPLNIVSLGQVMWEDLATESKALTAPPGE